MCGRLVLTDNYKERIQAIMEGLNISHELPPSYNITPSKCILSVLDEAPQELQWIPWGVPAHHAGRPPLINARGETVSRLPTFRHLFQRHRCIVFADGFYEWHRDKTRGQGRPQPYYVHLADGAMMILAGLWKPGAAASSLVITTEANRLMHPIHDRMPVILSPASAHLWLSHDTQPETLSALLQPCPSERMACHPVSSRVNRASSEGKELIQPVRIHEQPGLF